MSRIFVPRIGLHSISVPLFGPQRALLEQKQRQKRQQHLMVQPNTEVRPRRSRARRGEEQAPLVESQLNVTNDVIIDGEKKHVQHFLRHS